MTRTSRLRAYDGLSDAKEVINQYIDRKIPFALAALPGSERYDFFATVPEGVPEGTPALSHLFEKGRRFIIGFFDDERQPLCIGDDGGIDFDTMRQPLCTVDNYALCTVHCALHSTDYDTYARGAEYVISTLRATGGKTVLSRVIAVSSSKPIADVISDYFEQLFYTMRFVFYTAESGLWFGASPELLIENGLNGLKTMSLAGTRSADEQGEWDAKNLGEHQYVTDYLIDALRAEGLSPRIVDSTPLRFGTIEHLCDRIVSERHPRPISLIRRLSPTPALCGYPKAEAYEQISQAETHQRHCYGGWVAIEGSDGIKAYVNLRSAMAERQDDHTWLYNVYVGGGLTADSHIDDEWHETQAKAEILINCISR